MSRLTAMTVFSLRLALLFLLNQWWIFCGIRFRTSEFCSCTWAKKDKPVAQETCLEEESLQAFPKYLQRCPSWKNTIVVSVSLQFSLTKTEPGAKESNLKWWYLVIPGRVLKNLLKKSLQLYQSALNEGRSPSPYGHLALFRELEKARVNGWIL